jgi:succinoglycan biosynthesis transport protein ExoP
MDDLAHITLRDSRAEDAVQVLPPQAVVPRDLAAREPHLLDYLVILRKHQWLILTFLLTVVTVVTIASFKMKPIYVATARVEVDRESQNILPFQDASYDEFADLENYIDTQVKILESETLALLTIKSMDLGHYPEYGGQSLTDVPSATDTLKRPPILGQFLGNLSIKHLPNSRLVEVTFESEEPQLAAEVVNAHLQNFIEQNFRSRYEAATQASNWLSSELEELRIKMEESENARIAYERDNQIWTIDENQNITTQRLADLSKELTDAQADLLQRQATFQLAHSGEIDALPMIRDSVLVQELQHKLDDIDQQYSDSVEQFGPNYPRVQRLLAQKQNIETDIEREKKNSVERIDSDYNTGLARVKLLNEALENQKVEANEMAEKLVQYNVLKHDEESNKQLYDSLLQKLKEAGISAGLRSSNIRVVDPALTPAHPSRPNKARNILLAFLVGLVGGIGLAFFREYLDNTVKSPDDVELLTGLPSLAVVPSMTLLGAQGAVAGLMKGDHAQLGAAEFQASSVEMVSHSQPKSPISEAFRGMRTSLLLSQPDHPPRVILVTSALPREGKTTSAVNLAVTLAQLGDSTILVDADLRKPSIRKALNLPNTTEAGLSSYLAGVATLGEASIPHPQIRNLVAMPTGPIPPNPADLLSSNRMKEVIEELRAKYKFVVIDSPPIMAATDAVILSSLTDGVVLVVRSGETPKEIFLRCRDLLVGVKGRVLGVVLNAVDSSGPGYYYSYRYYPYAYGYGYGEEPKSGKKSSKSGHSAHT